MRRTPITAAAFFIFASVTLLARPIPAAAQTGGAREIGRIMQGLRERWDSLPGMSASFTHTFAWVLAGETQVTKGHFWLGPDDEFRVETGDRILVSDGKILWDYSPKQNQVLLNVVDPTRGVVSQQQLFSAYTEDVNVEWVSEKTQGDVRRVVLRLDRAPGADPNQVTVTVDTSRMLVVDAVYTDSAGNHHRYTLSDVVVGEQPAERFHFEVPAGVTVVDLRPGGGR